ncbi:hypothetical protein ER308_13185 [Egibacter rhizosphaerae]|uniref:Asp/Glu racemase n=1 Tax=Egibacter rhizosphaerae TaxID=1670831 RepID=A0A411YGK7_9ACTN|nr:aspartate/glutamate racemase family protein [Egibacter rhizosphaerae]QBI20425.1 hypothetical protein ER308_13185 [Egibacter rhizosphaerae]
MTWGDSPPPQRDARSVVGLVVPASNAVIEEDVRRHLGGGTGVLAARVGGGHELDAELLSRMAEEAEVEVAKLVEARPGAIAYGCTSGSFFGGTTYEHELRERLAVAAAGIPLVTAAGAVTEALRATGALRVGFASPYPAEVHARGCEHVTVQGFSLAGDACLGIADNHVIAGLPDEDLIALVGRVGASADAVLLSCTGLPTADRIVQLEAAAGVPVVTSNRALAEALRTRLAEGGVVP